MRATYCRRLRSAVLNCLLPQAVASALAAVTVSPAMAQSTATIGSTTLVNQGLVGVGRIPASMRDFFGETFGSVSGLSVDLSTWTTIGTVTVGASGVLNFEDTNSGSFSRRFYRTAIP